jgi:predicted metal-dependent phosphoesterase TrpH
MTGFCDLHTHSRASDGSDRPGELIPLAEKAGLSAIALTDHNTLAGLPEFLAAAEGSSVRAIGGIEFSTDWEDVELHIVALFVKPEHYGQIEEILTQGRLWKQESNENLARNLRKAGIPLDYQKVLARTDGIPNRAHFAAELTEMGVTGSLKEAIHSYLSPKNGLYVPPLHPDSLEIIGIIRDLGAVSVLAHPFLNLKEPRLREFLSQAKGLHAMETLYTDFTPELIQKAQAIADEFHLKQSGGTDYHGAQKPHIKLGQTTVPLSFLEALEAITN